jgi:hypothetical protein
VANDESNDSEVSANLLSVFSDTDYWILDSACSYHMCPNRQWFDIFKSCDAGTIMMGNDDRCKAIGIGYHKS